MKPWKKDIFKGTNEKSVFFHGMPDILRNEKIRQQRDEQSQYKTGKGHVDHRAEHIRLIDLSDFFQVTLFCFSILSDFTYVFTEKLTDENTMRCVKKASTLK